MTDPNLDRRLAALEARLGRLEQLLGTLKAGLEDAPAPGATKAAIQAWVTDYVSLRLQQLVPETCEHPVDEAPAAAAAGPVLPGTRVRCTEEVLHRLRRIPIPVVRPVGTQKGAQRARPQSGRGGDRALLERAAPFRQVKVG